MGLKDFEKILRYAVLDFRAVDFLDFTLRLCLSRSVENLLLTSSLALLDSTLPKIRQNDGRTKSDKTSECELALRRSRPLFFLVSWISFTKTSRSFHYVSTHFCFCNFETTFTSFTSALHKSARFRVLLLKRERVSLVITIFVPIILSFRLDTFAINMSSRQGSPP